jgi:hypothetical protein
MPDDTAHSKPPAASAHKRTPAVWWYGLGCALLGFLIGISAGLSESPIVAVMVPLLFALLSGGGGFYIAKANLADPAEKRRIATLGKLLSVFSILALTGAVYGALVRTGAPLGSLVPGFETRDSTLDYSTLTVDQALQVSALRLRLELLGVPPAQIKKTIEVARREFERGGKPSPELIRVVTDIKAAATRAKNLLSEAAADSSVKADKLEQNLNDIEQRYSYLLTLIQSSIHVDGAKLSKKLEEDSEIISSFVEFGPGNTLQAKHPELFQALVELGTRLDVPFLNLDPSQWRTNSEFLEQFDNVAKLVTGTKGGNSEERGRPGLRRRPSIRP